MRVFGLFVTLLLILVYPAQALEFHVSPAGNDSNPGSAVKPFATIEHARDTVRAWKLANIDAEAVTVWLHKGTYRITSPILFTPQDSGTSQFPVTYSAVAGEKPVVSGGVPITGWRKHGDNLWVANVTWAKALPEPFVQLFVNGKRRNRARTPNIGSYFYTKRLHYEGSGEAPLCMGMTFKEGNLKPWSSSEDAVICLFHNWVNSYNRVGKADWQRQRLDFTRPAGIFFLSPSVRYYVENLKSALDSPGEWYLDKTAGLLYYYPMHGEILPKAEVIAPVVKQTLIQLQGVPEAGQYVENIVFKGISFQHTDADLSREYRHSVQGAETQRGAIVARRTRNFVIENCELTRLGENAISLLEACSHNTVTRCHIHDLGGGGVYLSEQGPGNTAEWYLTAHNKVDNNFIHDGGYIFRAGCGVFMGATASYNQITHNEICDLSWMGVHMGWSWSSRNPAYTHHNEIAYNHIHHIGNGVLNDIAGIYTLGVSPGTVLHHNLIHDVTRFERGDEGYGGWGIYLDAGSSEMRVENNIVYNTRDGGLHLHCYEYPYEDQIVNNIFAYATSPQMARNNSMEPDTFHANLEHNIVYNENKGMYGGGNWAPGSKFTVDNNCYFSEKSKDPDFFGMTFAQWQAAGRDVHSVVADPGFINARKHDFRLKPNSPALSLGIKPIDMTTVGLRGHASWTKLPRKTANRKYEKAIAPNAKSAGVLFKDFEEYEAGDVPDGAVFADGATSVTVTDMKPASGLRCMRFVDDLTVDVWKPHWYATRVPGKGALHVQVKVRNDAASPVSFDLEFRDWPGIGGKYVSGPQLRFLPNGVVQACEEGQWNDIGRYKIGEWLAVRIDLSEGKGRANTYTVKLGSNGTPVTGIKFASDDFINFNWIGLAGMETKPGMFYADDIRVGRK